MPLPVLMLQKGMAVVYESSGAEYGKWGIDEMKRVEAVAKSVSRCMRGCLGGTPAHTAILPDREQKLGLWALPPSETPAEYKKRYRVGETETPSTTRAEETVVRTGSLVSRVLGRLFKSEVWRGN